MKKAILFYSFAAGCIFSVSCAKVNEGSVTDKEGAVVYGKDAIEAIIEAPANRTQIGSDGKSVVWSSGDSFALVSSDGEVAKFTLTSGEGSPTATFTGTAKGTAPYYAVYPYDENITMAGDVILFSTPSEQKGGLGNMVCGASPSVASMASASGTLYFRNLGGVLKLALKGTATISKLAVHDLMGCQMWGKCILGLDMANPEVEITDGGNTIVLNLENPVKLTSKAQFFYIAVPTGVFGHGFSITVYDKDGAAYSFLQTVSDNTMVRSSILEMPEITVGENSESADVVARGYYKDLFMDGGIHLTSRKTLPAADYIGWKWEYFASNAHSGSEAGKLNATDTLVQRELIQGTETDENGILLFPDGEPRFRCVYMNGGKSTNHGNSLEATGRARYNDFVAHGGTYVGTCAGAFLTCIARASSTSTTPATNVNFLHLWPGYTAYVKDKWLDENGAQKSGTLEDVEHRVRLVEGSPLLRYYDFGGDMMVNGVRHNGGPYMLDEGACRAPEGTEVLAVYHFPKEDQGKDHPEDHKYNCDTSAMHNKTCVWSYKKNDATGRIVDCGSHPEGVSDGERRDLMASFLRYASDYPGKVDVKGELVAGEARVMDRKTSDADPAFTAIGDRQYHHFKIEVPDTDNGVKVNLTCNVPGVDLYLAMKKGSLAWISDSEYVLCNSGSNKNFRTKKLEPGIWYVSVMCATTVTAKKTTYSPAGEYFKYSGKTAVLNGIPYTICYSLINPDGTEGADSSDTQELDYTTGGWEK